MNYKIAVAFMPNSTVMPEDIRMMVELFWTALAEVSAKAYSRVDFAEAKKLTMVLWDIILRIYPWGGYPPSWHDIQRVNSVWGRGGEGVCCVLMQARAGILYLILKKRMASFTPVSDTFNTVYSATYSLQIWLRRSSRNVVCVLLSNSRRKNPKQASLEGEKLDSFLPLTNRRNSFNKWWNGHLGI